MDDQRSDAVVVLPSIHTPYIIYIYIGNRSATISSFPTIKKSSGIFTEKENNKINYSEEFDPGSG